MCYLPVLLCVLFCTGVEANTVEPWQGRFFVASNQAGEKIYVFGTMHSEDARVVELPPVVEQGFSDAKILVLELELTPDAMLSASMASLLRDGTELAGLIPADLYARVVEAAEVRGLPEQMVRKLKPWAVVTFLSMPLPQTGMFLDRVLYQQALVQGKRVIGLETVQQQVGVFEQLDQHQQVQLLEATVAVEGEMERWLEEMTLRYLAGDLLGLEETSLETMSALESTLRDRLVTALVDQRNRRMVRQILGIEGGQPMFVAVGALHLPGETGILTSLVQAGYSVSRVL